MAFKTLFNQIGCGFSNIVTLRKKKEISFDQLFSNSEKVFPECEMSKTCSLVSGTDCQS